MFSIKDLKSAYHQVPIDHKDPFTAFKAAGNLYQFPCIPFEVTNGVLGFQGTIDWKIKEEKLKAPFAYLDDVTVCGTDQTGHDNNLSSHT